MNIVCFQTLQVVAKMDIAIVRMFETKHGLKRAVFHRLRTSRIKTNSHDS